MNRTIRRATADDVPLLLHWGRELHVIEQQFEPQLQFSLDAAQRRYQEELLNADACFLIIEVEGQALGYLYAHIQPTPAYFATSRLECILEVIYLEPAARGKGLADSLIHACSAWAASRGVWRIVVGIYAMNEASLHLFQRLGFQPYHVTLIKPLQEDREASEFAS